MPANSIVLSSVTACVECGTMQPSGFRGGTPIADPTDRERLERKQEVFGIDMNLDELPEHLDERYNVWMAHNGCPNCGNHFYHRLEMPDPAKMDAVDDPDREWVAWGDL